MRRRSTPRSFALPPWILAALALAGGIPAAQAQTGEPASGDAAAAPAVSAMPANDPDVADDVPPAPPPAATRPPASHREAGAPSADAAASAKPERVPPLVNGNPGGVVPPDVLRETPRQTVAGFLEAASAEDFERAAYYLDLRSVPASMRKTKGPELARLFAEVLDRTVWLDVETLPDDPEGIGDEGDTPPRDIRVVNVPMPGGSQGIRVERVRDAATGNRIWLFSKATVQAIDKLHAEHGLPDAVQQLPPWSRRRFAGMQAWQWGALVLLAALSWLAGRLIERPAIWAIHRTTRRTEIQKLDQLGTIAQGPVRRLVALIMMRVGVEFLGLSATAETATLRLVDIGLILVGMQAATRLVAFAAQVVLDESSEEGDDVARMKTVATRVTAVRRIANVIVFVVGIGLALMQFPVARNAGWSLLGSAGLAGAVLGFAAQKTVSNLFAGILIALTQPVRIGDTVIAEKEWGEVEEIGLTHVVVRIWDLRRLVLPVTWFLDQPFENWTRTSTELIGTVFVHVDYSVDVELVRAELKLILENQPLWNGKTAGVIVSELTARTAVLRVTVSADDASKLWDLRCLVREALLRFVQTDESRLPRWRMSAPAPR